MSALSFIPHASSSKGNLYELTDGSSRILIECGLPWREARKALRFQTSSVEGVLVSHAHADHSKGAKDAMKAGLDVYMTKGTADSLGLSGHRLKVIEPRRQFRVGPWTVLPFEVEHDAESPVGFLVASAAGEKLLFATDTYFVRYRFPGLSIIAIEASYDTAILNENVAAGIIPAELKKRLLRSHMSLSTLKSFLSANDLSTVRQIWLIHLSDNNSDASRFKREIQELCGKEVHIAA